MKQNLCAGIVPASIYGFFCKSPLRFWVIIFLLLNILVTQDGETNPRSRLAALRAMSEQHTFHIDDYRYWTIDWSQGPDGHYYSNKAPGSILLAFPVFWVLDTISLLWENNNRQSDGLRSAPGYFHKTSLSFLLQVIPLTILVLWIAMGISPTPAQHFFAIAILFGNTAALFANNWFGHAFTALLFLGAFFTFEKRQFFWSWLLLGFAVLSDYILLPIIPIWIIAAFLRRKNIRAFHINMTLGLLPAVLLWSWYHTIAFGSPFSISTQYYNPGFKDMVEVEGNLFGLLSIFPNPKIILELLFGMSRGILWTQPWALVSLTAMTALWVRNKLKGEQSLIFFMTSAIFLMALLGNSLVGSWHGGYTAGPRYISFVFPMIAYTTAITFPQLGKRWQWALWIGLGFSVLFRALVYATTILIPNLPLWPWTISKIFTPPIGTPLLRLTIFLLLFAWAMWKSFLPQNFRPIA